jgi:hypothetical protein
MRVPSVLLDLNSNESMLKLLMAQRAENYGVLGHKSARESLLNLELNSNEYT